MEAGGKILWKPGTLLFPLPAVLVSCGLPAGPRNLFTASWTGIVCSDPPMCQVAIRPQRYSHELIQASGEFAVNLTTRAMARAVDLCGVTSGRGIDKFALAGLTPVEAAHIAAPLVAESPVSLECRVTEVRPLGSHDLFLATIVAVQVSAGAVHPRSGALDPALLEPLCYCHGRYYALGGELGRFGFSVEKPKTRRRRLAERDRRRTGRR